jgi:ketosteroid isomerase-like protein
MMAADEDRIGALEDIRARAIVTADIAALDAMTGDGYVHVDGDGALRDKQGFLAALTREGGRFVHYAVIENHILVKGDLAVVTGSFENMFAADDGSRRGKRGRHVRAYVRTDSGDWSNILHQGTEIRG